MRGKYKFSLCFLPALVAVVVILSSCNREPKVVANAYQLLKDDMCREAIKPLIEEIPKHPKDYRIHRALCLSSLCVMTKKPVEKIGELLNEVDLKKMCKLGFKDAKDVNSLYMYALTMELLGDEQHGIVESASKQHSDHAEIKWIIAYKILDGRRRHEGVAPMKLANKDLGEVVVREDECSAASSYKGQTVALVKRGGSPIYAPGKTEKENVLEMGTLFTIQQNGEQRVKFIDTFYPHWKKNSGWIPVMLACQDKRSSSPDKRIYHGNKLISRDGWLPLSPSFVIRNDPKGASVSYNKYTNKLFFRNVAKVNCPRNGQMGLEKYGADIAMKPGSLKYIGTDDRILHGVIDKMWDIDVWMKYRKVAFEEKDMPIREVDRSTLFVGKPDCLSNYAELIKDYPEWDEETIALLMKGEIKEGMPVLFLSKNGYQIQPVKFTKNKAIVTWKKGNRTVQTEFGRVVKKPTP